MWNMIKEIICVVTTCHVFYISWILADNLNDGGHKRSVTMVGPCIAATGFEWSWSCLVSLAILIAYYHRTIYIYNYILYYIYYITYIYICYVIYIYIYYIIIAYHQFPMAFGSPTTNDHDVAAAGSTISCALRTKACAASVTDDTDASAMSATATAWSRRQDCTRASLFIA